MLAGTEPSKFSQTFKAFHDHLLNFTTFWIPVENVQWLHCQECPAISNTGYQSCFPSPISSWEHWEHGGWGTAAPAQEKNGHDEESLVRKGLTETVPNTAHHTREWGKWLETYLDSMIIYNHIIMCKVHLAWDKLKHVPPGFSAPHTALCLQGPLLWFSHARYLSTKELFIFVSYL